jgi:hypothetical protein
MKTYKIWKVFPAKHQHKDGPLSPHVKVSKDRKIWSYPLEAIAHQAFVYHHFKLEEVVSTNYDVVNKKCEELNKSAKDGELYEIREYDES